ncbi:hypothetical protein D3OALGA1CA_5086 [Olavius algarvensis associated proteobacterium Delta 3]|nr:hypothetical protein D3OALGA1CA_5086 [Olavius algarvensis associated proteobacterium Delta 3]
MLENFRFGWAHQLLKKLYNSYNKKLSHRIPVPILNNRRVT